SGHGIDGAILETGLGCPGTPLETAVPETHGGVPHVGKPALGAVAVEPGAPRAQDRFPGCRALGEAAGSERTDPQLRARSRATAVADADTAQVPDEVQPGPVAESA